MSIPLTFFGGIGGASRSGILIKGGNYLEALAQVKTIVFDKTGTLTQGVFQVTGVFPAEGFTEEALLETAALAESWSNHPIAQSLRAAWGKPVDSSRTRQVHEEAGHGLTAQVDDVSVAAGNARLMEQLGVQIPKATSPPRAQRWCILPSTELMQAFCRSATWKSLPPLRPSRA